MRPGQAVEARFPALPGEVVKGRVAAVLPEANRDTRTLRAAHRAAQPRPAPARPGLFAQVSLRGPQREALVVPAEAVIRTGKRALVYVAEEPGRYRPVEVRDRRAGRRVASSCAAASRPGSRWWRRASS